MTPAFPRLAPARCWQLRHHLPVNIEPDVLINGGQVLGNYDIYADAGGKNVAVAKTFTATANSSGQIVISFTSVKDNAKVSAVAVTPN